MTEYVTDPDFVIHTVRNYDTTWCGRNPMTLGMTISSEELRTAQYQYPPTAKRCPTCIKKAENNT